MMKPHDLPWSRWLSVIVTVVVFAVLVAIIAPLIQQSRIAARKSTSKNNLKQFGIAFHNYHDLHECFPSGAIVNNDGMAFHGWFTFLMPYLDASPYYDQIDFDAPWNDPENAPVFRHKYAVALMPSADETYTRDGFALSHYLGNPNVFHRNSSIKFKDMKAGRSETWLVGEVAGNYQPWGYPFNWRELGTNLNAGPDSYGRPTGGGAYFLMADATVRFIENEADPKIFKSMTHAPPLASDALTQKPKRRFEYAGVR